MTISFITTVKNTVANNKEETDMNLIAFTGFKQVGKTTSAKFLTEDILSFAEPIKLIAKKNFSWDEIKDEKGRKLLQGIGHIARAYNSRVWVDILESNLIKLKQFYSVYEDKIFCVDDLRFDNEAEMLKEHGAIIIKITRPGYESDGHSSELGIDEKFIDLTVQNDSNIEALEKKIKDLFP